MPVVGYSPGMITGADSGVNSVIELIVPAGESLNLPVLHIYGMSRLSWVARLLAPNASVPVTIVPQVGFRAKGQEPGDNNWQQNQLVPVPSPAITNGQGVAAITYNTVVAEVMSGAISNLDGPAPVAVQIILSASA